MAEILIHKIKVTKNGVSIIYDDPAFSGEPDGVAREGKGEARPSFYKAMNALRDNVINICLLDPNGWDAAEITGVTLKHLDGDIGVVITAQNKNEELASPININTPYLIADQELKAKLERVQAEARDYLNGKRAQVSLFDEDVLNVREEALVN
ncbi:hypothetical protein [Allocoleopsis sp.]|uniref:hypothetical protein n=1 Tax=Allocoleopsis sp. TaxID=3088169 RepID=UPI002FD1A58D